MAHLRNETDPKHYSTSFSEPQTSRHIRESDRTRMSRVRYERYAFQIEHAGCRSANNVLYTDHLLATK